MSSVSTVSSQASATYAQILAAAQKTAAVVAATTPSTASSGGSATNVTLSAEAQAALAAADKDFTTVTSDARTTLDKLLADAGLTSPLKDGKLALDLSKVDRRELYAISTNAGQKFTVEEQKAAGIELQNRFDAALAGPTAVSRVTGTIKNLYVAALAYFDQMGPEEKASAAYSDQRAALEGMLKKLETDPATLPSGDLDPVNTYLKRVAEGETGELRDIGDVASDARTTLDSQYAAGGSRANYKDFDSRSLAAVALNSGNKFSAEEVRVASSEMRTRSGAALLASLKHADASNPASFAENVISLYGAMSTEERAAAGWSDKLYAAAVSSYTTASKLTSMLGAATGSSVWGGASSNTSTNSSMSIFGYL